MSYIALLTTNFEAMVAYYTDRLQGEEIKAWDRERARGTRLEVFGQVIEVLDARREVPWPRLGGTGRRVQLVFEVPDVDDAVAQWPHARRPTVHTHSWGARGFTDRDPDNTIINVLEWFNH